MGVKQIKREAARLVGLTLALIVALLLCVVSLRMYDASRSLCLFDGENPSFSDLFLYACNPYHPRSENASMVCINNLRQIDGAKQQWAYETKAPTNAIPSWEDLRRYFGRVPTTTNVLPQCPRGGTYFIRNSASDPICTVKGHHL
jgi:hypothetical protein